MELAHLELNPHLSWADVGLASWMKHMLQTLPEYCTELTLYSLLVLALAEEGFACTSDER